MKRLTIIFLIFSSMALYSQDWKRGMAIVGYHVGSVALGAVADGLFDDGHKAWGHALHVAEIGAVMSGPFIFKPRGNEFISYILSYGFIRLSLFDFFYNATRDLPMDYVGSTSGYDNFMRKIPPDGRFFIKGWALTIGIVIPINEL